MLFPIRQDFERVGIISVYFQASSGPTYIHMGFGSVVVSGSTHVVLGPGGARLKLSGLLRSLCEVTPYT